MFSKIVFSTILVGRKRLLWVGLMGLAICLAGTTAYAETIGGHSGHGWPNEALGCFQGSTSMMINIQCPTKRLVIPLVARTMGFTNIIVRARGNGASPTTCWGLQNNPDGSFIRTVPVSTSSSSLVPLALGDLYLPPGNTLSVECDVPLNGGVLSVVWTQ
jgi:hypothetical protein